MSSGARGRAARHTAEEGNDRYLTHLGVFAMSHFDVIIIGSGIVGSTAALALAQEPSLKIAIIDSQPITQDWQNRAYDHRVSAISLGSRRIFKNIKVWEKVEAKRISPYTRMFVWEEGGEGKIEFDCGEVYEDALGYIIEDNVMRASLHEMLMQQKNIHLFPAMNLIELNEKSDQIELISADKKTFTANLIIGADGAHSWTREQCGIELKQSDYEQTAIVATIKTASPHQTTAWQRFLKTGPLAFLPLKDEHYSSIVWSATPAFAKQLLEQDEESFKQSLVNAFENKLGQVVEVSKRYHFPLKMRHAKNYVKQRVAIIGDAAHTIHPLAGQGVNLGLLDAACLSEIIINAVHKQRDFGNLATLRRYERWRKSDNLVMLSMVDVLKSVFMSNNSLIKSALTFGLNLTNRLSLLKNFFTNYALGNRDDLPEIAKN